MYRISTFRQGHSGAWHVLPGKNHTPDKLDNKNLFFESRIAADAKCRELNK